MKHRQVPLFQSQSDAPGGLAPADVERFPGAGGADIEHTNHGIPRWTRKQDIRVTNRLRPTDSTTVCKTTTDPEDTPDALAIDPLGQHLQNGMLDPLLIPAVEKTLRQPRQQIQALVGLAQQQGATIGTDRAPIKPHHAGGFVHRQKAGRAVVTPLMMPAVAALILALGGAEAGMVQRIGQIHVELQAIALVNDEILLEREIEITDGWPLKDLVSRSAETADIGGIMALCAAAAQGENLFPATADRERHQLRRRRGDRTEERLGKTASWPTGGSGWLFGIG